MLEGSLRVTVGENVRFEFVVTNTGADPVEVTFRNGGQADFVVYEEGSEVWRWSEGRMFTQMLQPATFDPGDEAVFEEVWPDAQPGDYTAEATLRVQEVDVTARTPFSV